MANIKHHLPISAARNLSSPCTLQNCLKLSFGELMYEHRARIGVSQRKIALAAGMSESYLSELENCKRIAPPHSTAMRIAEALKLSPVEANFLSGIAESERGAQLHDRHLPPQIQQLMAMLRFSGDRLPADVLNLLKDKLQEGCV
jgi:transcriptional regulator with XRE-family HTH domain